MAYYDHTSGYSKINLFGWIYQLTKIKKPQYCCVSRLYLFILVARPAH